MWNRTAERKQVEITLCNQIWCQTAAKLRKKTYVYTTWLPVLDYKHHTTKKDIWRPGCKAVCVKGPGKWPGGPHLGCVVLGGTDEHSQIHWWLDVIDLPAVLLGLLQNLPRLSINNPGTTVNLSTSNNNVFFQDKQLDVIHFTHICWLRGHFPHQGVIRLWALYWASITCSLLHSRQCVSNLGAELVDLSVLMTSNDELSQRSPHSAGDLVIAAG